MEITLNIWHIFVLIGALQGFALTAFLAFHKKGNIFANRTLAILIFTVSTDAFVSFLYLSNYIHQLPHFISVSEPLYVLHGPLLYLYTKQLITPRYKFRAVYLLFFMPSILETLLWMPFYLQSAELKLHDYSGLSGNLPLISSYWIIWNLELFYNMAFVLMAAAALKKHERAIKNAFSDISRISFKWLRRLILAAFVVLFFEVVILYLVKIVDMESFFVALYCFIAILFYGIGYMGLRQPEVFSGAEDEIEKEYDKQSKTEPTKKYAKSSLSDEKAQRHLEKLLQLMENEKLYLQSDLKLNDVAKRLDISTNHLSQAINTKTGKNFFDFVNTYRVREAQRMLLDSRYEHLNLLGIGFKAGFSSKSSFNKVFKDISTLTPSQYRQKNRQETSSEKS